MSLEEDYSFICQIDQLKNDKVDAVAFSGNPFIRSLIYEYCKKHGLKATRTKAKTVAVICTNHKCICYDSCTNEEFRCYHTYGGGSRCISCNYSCPKSYEDDYGCSFEEYRPKLPVIYVHKKDLTINELKKIDEYPLTLDSIRFKKK